MGVFLAAYWIPFDSPLVGTSIIEAFHLLQEYAREHVLLCLVPAFFIAGAIANFVWLPRWWALLCISLP